MEKQPYIRLNLASDHAGRKLGVVEIAKLIKEQILNQGDLSGCRLPPVRVLAHQLGISKNTVQTAYEELKAQGLVESRNRSGLFVQRNNEPRSSSTGQTVPKLNIKNFESRRYSRKKNKNLTELSSVFIDPRILPREKIEACFRSVLKSPGMAEFPDLQGFLPLREKIAERLTNRGMEVHAGNIVITNGSMQALDLVSRAVEGQVVATENPAFYGGKKLFEMNGLKTIGLPLNPFQGIDEDEWERLIALERPGLVYLTTNFQNPNGYSYTSREISKIVQWAREYNFGIIEDDWGSDMLSFSEFKPGLRTLGGNDVYYMNSFTKKLLPSLRSGYLVATDEGLQTILTAKAVSTSAIPSIIESTLFEFLDRGYYDTHLKYIQEELDIRYNHLLNLLRSTMPEDVSWTMPGGGPILWLELPKRISLQNLIGTMRERGYSILPSDDAFFGTPHMHGFKIGYALLNTREMDQAVDVLSVEIKRLANV